MRNTICSGVCLNRISIEELKGPENNGRSVFIEGRFVPDLVMYDRGEEIEFVLDHRLSVSFPRAQAWNAVAFAFGAMALGAGCDPLNFEPKPFARKVCKFPPRS